MTWLKLAKLLTSCFARSRFARSSLEGNFTDRKKVAVSIYGSSVIVTLHGNSLRSTRASMPTSATTSAATTTDRQQCRPVTPIGAAQSSLPNPFLQPWTT